VGSADQKSTISDLTQSQKDEAQRKYRLIQPFLQNERTLASICNEHNIPLRTARTWVSLYRRSGLAALARKQRIDEKINHGFPEELYQLIEGLYLQSPHLSYAAVYRKIKEYQIAQQSPCPKYRTICKILSNIPESMLTLAHEGSKAYKEKFDLLHRFEAKQPNEIWQADHVCLDLLLLNQKNNAQRPWLTIIFDDHTRSIAGYELSFSDPSAMKTALCLRMAICSKKEPDWTICGIPQTLYTDHGSDFTSIHMEQVCTDLKINLIFSQVAQPRGRGKIERFFLKLNQLLLCDLPGYVKAKNSLPKLSLADCDLLIRKFIIEYNQTYGSVSFFL